MKRRFLPPIACLPAILFVSPLFGGQPLLGPTDYKNYKTAPATPDDRLIFRVTSSYVFDSDFIRGHDAHGDAWSKDFELGYRMPISLPWPSRENGGWYLRLGARYQRYDFDNEGGLPIPNTLQSAAGVVALEYLVDGRRAILLSAEPGVYFEHEITSGAFDVPVKIALPIELNDSFAFVVGASYAALRSYPILPIVGFNWRINDQWTIRAIPPDPRIIYAPSDKLNFWVGGELAGGSFRTDSREVHPSSLNGAVLTYSDWRVGAGITCRHDFLTLEVSGGYSFDRKFDYYRVEKGFETDGGAPYAAIEVQAAF
jgi:hypothetical protein